MENIVIVDLVNPTTGVSGKVEFAKNTPLWQLYLMLMDLEQQGWEVRNPEVHRVC